MRTPYAVAFMLTLLLAGTYMYQSVGAVCPVPISYQLGDIDSRFAITTDEARVAIADAESIWEEATGRNLFTYSEDADVVINFVFDDRQALADAESEFREELDESEERNQAISATYAELVAQYSDLEFSYKEKLRAYEERLFRYNKEVEQYNAEGGAPREAFAALQKEQRALDAEITRVNALGEQLNALSGRINLLSEEGNAIIQTYNKTVNTYNDTFSAPREFTQGDYQGTSINIYTFTNPVELRLVLTHELGHALWLEHVEGDTSIMYDHLGEQPDTLTLTAADLEEFERVCGLTTSSWLERLKIRFAVY